MSVARRLISGSTATWLQIAVTIMAQVVLVPLYLSCWKVEVYGIWIAIQALTGILSTPDLGHHTFLGYEFLRLGQNKRDETSFYLWSALPVGLTIGCLQVLIMAVLIFSGLFSGLITGTAMPPPVMNDAAIVMLLQGIVWMLTTSAGGIFVRVLTAFDYYPRLAWWGVMAGILTSAAPAVSVFLGAGLLTAGIVLAITTLLFNAVLYIDIFCLLRKEGLLYRHASFRFGLNNFICSLALSGRCLLETIRTTGVRVVLTPLAGMQALVTFSTIRTGANFAMQGLHSITNPLMPELMKFLHQRDQERSETAFGTIWIIVMAVLAPGVVVLQAFIEPVFHMWTRGRLTFDPFLFALLSLGVLIYAVSQPAMAIVTGNNLLKVQLGLSGMAAFIVVAGMAVLVPLSGIRGAGAALLAAEIFAARGYRMAAARWLKNHGLKWPSDAAMLALRSVWLSAAAMAAVVFLPGMKWLILVTAMILLFLNVSKYWHTLPAIARNRSRDIAGKLPVLKKKIILK